MQSEIPLVSVLMTAYNREKYIGEAIESVLSSTYTNFELIIVDDCSKDETVNIAKAYTFKDHRVKLFVNENNLGDYPNRNRAASYAKGKYLKYLDSDDMIFPHSLKLMVTALEKFPEAGMAMMWPHECKIDESTLCSSEMALKDFFINNLWLMVGPSGCIYSKEVFFELGGFSGKKYVGDFEFNMNCILKYPIVKIPNGLIVYRTHDQQQGLESGHSKTYRTWLYKIQNNVLMDTRCPLSEEDRLIAIKKINRLQSRRVIFHLVKKLNLIESYRMITDSGLGWMNLFKGLISFK